MKNKLNSNSFIICKLCGGLGNQMFQYAAAYTISLKYASHVFIDTRQYVKEFNHCDVSFRNFELECFHNLKYSVASSEILDRFSPSMINFIKKHLGYKSPKTYIEKTFDFDSNFIHQHPPLYLTGYWQSYKYFNNVESYIRNIYMFQEHLLDARLSQLLHEIRNTNSLAIHVRRGDYLKPNNINFHGYCDLDYFKKAITFISNIHSALKIFYFTDDPVWVRDNLLSLYPNSSMVSDIADTESWHDMFLMSMCKNIIISNSSYSWWAAWLNSNKEKIVVAPLVWYQDSKANSETASLIPHSWVRL